MQQRQRDRRGLERLPLSGAVPFSVEGGAWETSALQDLSLEGARLVSDAKPELGAPVFVRVTPGVTSCAFVARHTDDGFAVTFDPQVERSDAYVLARLLQGAGVGEIARELGLDRESARDVIELVIAEFRDGTRDISPAH